MFARYALLTSLALPLPRPWGRAQGTGGQHLQLHLSFCISGFLHFSHTFPHLRFTFLFCNCFFQDLILYYMHGSNACTKPSGLELLATQLIDCSRESKNYKIYLHEQLKDCSPNPEQAELRGAVPWAGVATALVSRWIQHHSPDCGKPRWAPFMDCCLIFLFSGSEMYMAFGVKAGKVG